ncbi:MAG: peroxiredoxin [Gammaproteobacteria bacterium]|nr:peroxiredoxin [Gammaproteobacteria bacterium]
MKNPIVVIFLALLAAGAFLFLSGRFAGQPAVDGQAPAVMPAASLVVGERAPEFELPDQTGQLHSLEDYHDQWVVLYFYPKDETPGCTTEACEFRDNIFAFRELNAQILGVSLDDVESHREFADKYSLPFPLLADVEGEAADAYGVKTRMLGMTVAKRQTFIIAPGGNLARHYEAVDPDSHSAEVLADLKALSART